MLPKISTFTLNHEIMCEICLIAGPGHCHRLIRVCIINTRRFDPQISSIVSTYSIAFCAWIQAIIDDGIWLTYFQDEQKHRCLISYHTNLLRTICTISTRFLAKDKTHAMSISQTFIFLSASPFFKKFSLYCIFNFNYLLFVLCISLSSIIFLYLRFRDKIVQARVIPQNYGGIFLKKKFWIKQFLNFLFAK